MDPHGACKRTIRFRCSSHPWSQWAAEIDGDAPIAVLLAPSTGRHARTHDRHLPFGALQVQRLESFYWRFYAPDPADPSRYTARDRSMLNAMVTDQSAGTSAPAMKPTQGRHSTAPRRGVSPGRHSRYRG
ncbi:hypothetical protein [Streptosporangium canum]|uniref:hypothetical protein n=1 Tax=Streptosporangium canum TaxID=324952 RepID=UPI0037AE303A